MKEIVKNKDDEDIMNEFPVHMDKGKMVDYHSGALQDFESCDSCNMTPETAIRWGLSAQFAVDPVVVTTKHLEVESSLIHNGIA